MTFESLNVDHLTGTAASHLGIRQTMRLLLNYASHIDGLTTT
jgi:hypothetical protein